MHYDIVDIAKKHLSLLQDINHAYLFGSVLDINKEPNDIDVLIIYSKYTSDMYRRIQEFAKVLETSSGIPTDLTILSIEEEKQVCFLERIEALQFK